MRNSWRAAHRLLLVAGALFVAFSCHESSSENVEGETHFLRACEATKSSCGSSLSCVCGVCTVSCSEQNVCSGLAESARCITSSERAPGGACVDTSTAAVCDLPCTRDEQCHSLSTRHQCANGYCRRASGVGGVGGESGTGGAGNAAGAAGANAGAPSCPDGLITGNEVVVLGDAMVAQSHQIPTYLTQMAREANVLLATESFRDYSTTSENSLALIDTYLAKQFDQARAEASTKVVVLCGGGADVLAGFCPEPVDASCQILVDAASAAERLLAQMAQAEVKDVIWFFYPDHPSDAALRAEMDLLRPMLQNHCANASIPCHFIDLRPVFEGHYDEYLRSDGMTPTDAGAQATATAIWEVLKQQCLAR